MHELSLAQSLINQLLGLADEHKATQINRVEVTIGPFSGIVADSFSFGFSVLKEHQPATKNAELLLITPAPEYRCLACNETTIIPLADKGDPVRLAGHNFSDKKCSQCGSNRLSPEGGTDLVLNQLEME